MPPKKGATPAKEPFLFDPFASLASQVDSVVLMLRSTENDLILRALRHLDTYASKYIGNFAVLHEHQLLPALYPLLATDQRFARRFAFKILSQMLSIPEAADEMRASHELYEAARRNYIEQDDDNWLIEYSADVLCGLCADGSEHLATSAVAVDLQQSMFARMLSTRDPDILYRTLELLNRIATLPEGKRMLCASLNFPFAFLLATTRNSYTRIQSAALECLTALTDCEAEQFTQRFADPLFLEEMFAILENFLWFDMHSGTIELMRRAVKRPAMAERFQADGLHRFMEFMNTTLHHRLEGMGVLAQMAAHPVAREALFEERYTDLLLNYLAGSETGAILSGIARMTPHGPALREFLDGHAVGQLFGMLADRNLKLAQKVEVAECLWTLFAQSKEACVQGLECPANGVCGMPIVADMLRNVQPEMKELKRWLVRMLGPLAKQRALKPRVMNYRMAKGLYYTFRTAKGNNEFVVELLNCISNYLSEEPLRDEILQMDMHKHLIECLQSDDTALRSATINMMLTSCKYSDFSDMYIDEKVLDCLFANAPQNTDLPNWAATIEAILANNLPVKFAMRGHLDLTDRTADDFYATNKIWTHYRRLRELFINHCAPRRPIYLCNANRVRPSVSNMTMVSAYSRAMRAARLSSVLEPNAGGSGDAPQPISQETATGLLSIDQPYFNTRPDDKNLVEYLRIVRDALAIQNVPKILRRIEDFRRCCRCIADVVCSKLCGEPFRPLDKSDPPKPIRLEKKPSPISSLDSGNDSLCSCQSDLEDAIVAQQMELRRDEYDCNIIPLGAMRVGGFLEKALMFKVLADQVGLPCVLHMDADDNRIVWNEVALPLFEDVPKECGDMPMAELKQPTHIVDLMDEPGELYSIGCKRAQQYLLKE